MGRSGTCCATGIMLADEIARVQAGKRHAVANTPLASEQLVSKPNRAKRPGTRRQPMKYARRKYGSY